METLLKDANDGQLIERLIEKNSQLHTIENQEKVSKLVENLNQIPLAEIEQLVNTKKGGAK